ncbi:hypothetical protein NC651_035176 [Populus alba x Populus x berolinensis]|nr:hypothetical protein NC651_035176 [Populus alba x Populus x berolinensis]
MRQERDQNGPKPASRMAIPLHNFYPLIRARGLNCINIELLAFTDSDYAKDMEDRKSTSRRSKHIDVKYHYLRNLTRECTIALVHYGTQDQVADLMTKPLKLDAFLKLRELVADLMTKPLKLDAFLKLRELLGVQEVSNVNRLKFAAVSLREGMKGFLDETGAEVHHEQLDKSSSKMQTFILRETMPLRIWDKKQCDRGFNQGLVPELEGAAGSMAETASPCNSYWPGRASTSSAKFSSKTLVMMLLQQLTMDRKVPNRSWKILILLNCSSIIGGTVPWSVNYLSHI